LLTYGGVNSANALHQTQQLFSRRGFLLLSAALLPAAHTYNQKIIHLAENLPDEQELWQVQTFILQSLQKLQNGIKEELKLPNPFNPVPFRAQHFLASTAAALPKQELDLCTKCTVCKAVCPMGAIREDLTIIRSQCIRCMACVKNCPNSARKLRFRTFFPTLYLSCYLKKRLKPSFYI